MRYGLRRATAAFMFFIMLFTSIPTDAAVAASLSSQTSTNVTESVDNETAAAVSQNDETDDITPPSEDPSDEVIDAAPAEEDDTSLPEDAAPADPAEEEEEDSPEIAEYDANDNYMHLYANGGVFSNGKTVYDMSPYYYIKSYVPTREGYVFTGWYADEDGEQSLSDDYDPRNLAESPEAGTKIYAGWTQDYWTITFDFANGTYNNGTKKGGNGYFRSSDHNYKKETVLTYYIPKSWPRGLNTGYGAFYPNSSSDMYSNDIHYSFYGWTLDNTSIVYPYSYTTLESDLTFYAVFDKNKTAVTFHAGRSDCRYEVYEYDDVEGGSKKVTAQSIIKGYTGTSESISKTDSTLVPKTSNARLVFAGWYTDETCETPVTWYSDYSCNTETDWNTDGNHYLKLDGDYDLYAKWEESNKLLIFDANGGYFSNSDNGYSDIVTTTEFGGAKDSVLSYESVYNPHHADLHYEFKGWYSTAACTGDPVYDPETSSYITVRDYTFGDSDVTLYAKWEQTRHVVTVNMNGGVITSYRNYKTGEYASDVSENEIQYPTNSNNKMADTPSNSYVKWPDGTKAFGGWYTAATGGTKIDSLYNKIFESDATIYAQWIPVYTITFDPNGGRIAQKSTYVDGEYIYSDYVEKVEEKTGEGGTISDYPDDSYVKWWKDDDVSNDYVFLGWFTDKTAGEKVQYPRSYIPEKDTTLYAHWVPSYTITFDANNGRIARKYKYNSETDAYEYSDFVESVSYKTASDGTLSKYPQNSYVFWWKEGTTSDEYAFSGWYTEKTGGEKITDFYYYVPGKALTLYAHWVPVYEITFDANDGRIATKAKYNYSTGQTDYSDFVETKTVKTGGTGKLTDYPDNSYIKWWENGDVSNAKAFEGWYTEKTGGEKIESLSQYVPTANGTLYAHWAPVYTITFNANGGTIHEYVDGAYQDLESVTRTTNGQYKLAQSAPTNLVKPEDQDVFFRGWYVSTDENRTLIPSSNISSYVFEGDTTLMAYWQPKYTITFDANGGKIRVAYYGDDSDWVSTRDYYTKANGTIEYYYYVPDDDEVKGASDKYKFEGWYTEKDGGTKITDWSTYEFTKNTTVYAHYSKLVTVTFNANGGKFEKYVNGEQTWVTEPREYVTKSDGTLSDYPDSHEVKRDDYVFLGWYTKETGGNEITSFYSYKFAEDTTIYAHWSKLTEITLDPNGGKLRLYDEYNYDTHEWSYKYTTNPIKCKMNQYGNFEDLPDGVEKDGYYFVGWYT